MFIYLIFNDNTSKYINTDRIISIQDLMENDGEQPTFVGSEVLVDEGDMGTITYKCINLSINILDQIRRAKHEQ